MDEFDEVPPDASSMVESMRAHGYTLSTALADIIDNSIAAACNNVWLRFEFRSDGPWVAIIDDGRGMTESELVNAMRLGSRSPLDERTPEDLGRFGLGLKTASFSQARRLTVISKTKEESRNSVRRWDLDHLARPEVEGWQLLKAAHLESEPRVAELEGKILKSGTLILLERLDRVVGPESNRREKTAEDHWVAEVARVREHLSMVFHRFLTDRSVSGIRIWLNDCPIEAWDPFCIDQKATQKIAADSNCDLNAQVTVTGFVLPHRDRFDLGDSVRSAKLHKSAAGPAGWNAQQGFYVYRNRRLIIPGDWLGLGPGQNGWKKEEHYKLVRIQVDIPNSLDQEWQIDVKKSTAIAPPALRSWMSGLAKTVRERAKEVYAFRGGRPARRKSGNQEHPIPWVTKTRSDGTFSYRIDRKHPLFQALTASVHSDHEDELNTLLRLIEETVPIQRIWIDTADNQDGVSSPFEGDKDSDLQNHLMICHQALASNGQSSDEAWDELAAFPAFQTQSVLALIGLLRG